jgi:hypothetical protein
MTVNYWYTNKKFGPVLKMTAYRINYTCSLLGVGRINYWYTIVACYFHQDGTSDETTQILSRARLEWPVSSVL